jgi:hypothetical protein
MWHIRRRICTGFWWGKTEGMNPCGRQTQRQQDNIKMSYKSRVEVDWIDLRIWTSGRHLQTQQQPIRMHKIQIIS